MTRKMAVLLLALSWLVGCKGEGEPGAFEKFITPFPYKPGVHAEMCSNANDGKRFWLEGYMQISGSIRIEKARPRSPFSSVSTATAGAAVARSRST